MVNSQTCACEISLYKFVSAVPQDTTQWTGMHRYILWIFCKVSFIAWRYLVMVTGRSLILKLRKRLVHAVAERVLPEMLVILWIGEIFLTNLWYPMGNNKNIILS